MATEKQVEFEVGARTYRAKVRLDNTYDIHGFNSLSEKVMICDDLITGDRFFVNWSHVPVIRFIDDPEVNRT